MKKIIKDISRLVDYAQEIEMVTGYKGQDRPNFQKLRMWILKKEEEYKNEARQI